VLLETYKFKGNTKLFVAEILMLDKLTLLCELHILSIWVYLEWHSRCL